MAGAPDGAELIDLRSGAKGVVADGSLTVELPAWGWAFFEGEAASIGG